jgi:phosphoenolpyruvate carboxylase
LCEFDCIFVVFVVNSQDAGRLAASWAQYNAQERMVEVAAAAGVELTFFHGKGGTVGRGGNPALFEAILAHPPNTINGRFRVTEQGEMITQNLGEEAVAERTLDLFTAGVLAERFAARPEVKPQWREAMQRLSEVSCDAYRAVVRGEPRFVPYFRAATPELQLGGLNVGSRPSKRNPQGGVESLRAIPWVFAWTQTRLNLPTWLGVGEALGQELQRDPQLVHEMYREWPWFRSVIDLLEMILVKSDAVIAANYDAQLVSDADSLALGRELRAKMQRTTEALLVVSGNASLQAHNSLLRNSLAVRNPYVDPLNVIQAELLCRLPEHGGPGNMVPAAATGAATGADAGAGAGVGAAAVSVPRQYSEEEIALMRDALLITINGIANGMRNSG